MAALTRVRWGWSIRLRYGADLRGRFRMPDLPEAEARARARRLERMAQTLADAGKHVEARVLLQEAAAQRDGGRFAKAEAMAAEVAAEAGAAPRTARAKTFRDVCELLWSGELHRMAPDRVALGTPLTQSQRRHQLEVLCESIGDIPINRVTLDTAERAIAALPRGLSRGTRKNYAQRLMYVMKLAALPPLRVIEQSPIPTGWAPSYGPRRAFAFLYPDEDARLMRCSSIPLERRLLWGFLAREGCRISEALALKWSDIDTARYTLRLDRNKTCQPRTWRIGQDVACALQEFQRRNGAGAENNRVFQLGGTETNAAKTFRDDLASAGIDRAELFERTAERAPIRAHDLRGSFVTLALASGRTEAWVMDRTGHTTSAMLSRYRRQARFAEETGLGWYQDLAQLLGLGRDRDKKPSRGSVSAVTQSPRRTYTSTNDASTEAKGAQLSTESGGSGRPVPAGNERLGHSDRVELELSEALRRASEAGAWEAVAALAVELGERRRARGGAS